MGTKECLIEEIMNCVVSSALAAGATYYLTPKIV